MADIPASADSDSATTAPGALSGIRVLDLTSVVLGPFATQMLGDMGADVIKVESPDGDIMRHAEPMRSEAMGAVFLNINRNKRSIALDLKTSPAREALFKLVATADVLIHSMRPQAISRLGLTYEQVAAVRPEIIYCATIGFSSRGPYGDRPAYDDVIQGMSGLADLARRRSGGDPEFAPSIICDKICGLTAYGAVLTALFHRQRTGVGQAIEVPMFETMAAFTLAEHLAGHAFSPPRGDIGYTRCVAPERRPYRTADGFMAVLPYSTRHWIGFFQAAGRPEMCEDPRVASPSERSRNIKALYSLVADIMTEKTTAEWTELLAAADVPSVAVKSLEDLESDPHLESVGFFVDYLHPTEGAVRTTAAPVQYGKTPAHALHRPPPRLGQHSREILTEAGYTRADIDDMIRNASAYTAN